MSKKFWLNKYTGEYHLGKLGDADIHVIEYSAYDKLESALKRVKEVVKDQCCCSRVDVSLKCTFCDLLKEIQDLVGE